MSISETLMERVKREVDKGNSINQIAKASGVSQPALYRWYTGAQPDLLLSNADKLAAHFGLHLTEIRRSTR